MTDNDRLTAYLTAEVTRYFPTANHVSFDYAVEEEAIHLFVIFDGGARAFIQQAGSDDDWFTFTAVDADFPSFTVPLMAEEL